MVKIAVKLFASERKSLLPSRRETYPRIFSMLRFVYPDGSQGGNWDLNLQGHATRLTAIMSIDRTKIYYWKYSFNDSELKQLRPMSPPPETVIQLYRMNG